MATTAVGNPYVESSDLVANYPAASLALANRIDVVGVNPFANAAARDAAIPSPVEGQMASLNDDDLVYRYSGAAWVAVGTTPGITLIATQNPSVSSSVIFNNCFSSTYENYLINVKGTYSAATSLSFRLRVAASDNTTSNYLANRLVANGGTISGTAFTATSFQQVAYSTNDDANALTLTIFSPQLTARTSFVGSGISQSSTITNLLTSGFFNATTSFDGFTLLPASGTFTGTVRVYGYKN